VKVLYCSLIRWERQAKLHRMTTHSRQSLHGGSTAGHDYTAGSRSGALVGHWVCMGVATWVTMRVVVTTPLTVTLSLASELEPPLVPGTPTGTLLWSRTLVTGPTRLSAWWKGSEDSSDRWMTLHMCKWRCKPPSTHKAA
jgi:hypothetical protein